MLVRLDDVIGPASCSNFLTFCLINLLKKKKKERKQERKKKILHRQRSMAL